MNRILVCFLIVLNLQAVAQHLQVHYDFGEDRQYVTSTLEMFRPTDTGAWFWFVDFDYDSEKGSANLAYWEIARYFTLPVWDNKLSAKLEYNDGVVIGEIRENNQNVGYWGAPLHNVWLTGLSYPINLAGFTLQTELLFRYMQVSDAPDWQFTFVWMHDWFEGRMVFSGYLDLWSQDLAGDKKWILQTEPQLWYMATSQLGLGGEVEISRNFLPQFGSEVKLMPTLGVKWIF